jgi:taurine dioxygenase
MAYTALRIDKLTPHVGAEVHGVDLSRPLDERTFKEVHDVLIDNGRDHLTGES